MVRPFKNFFNFCSTIPNGRPEGPCGHAVEPDVVWIRPLIFFSKKDFLEKEKNTSSDSKLKSHLCNSPHTKGAKLQFDIIFFKIYYAKIRYLRTFREFCSNPRGSGIRKMKIAAEWSLMVTITIDTVEKLIKLRFFWCKNPFIIDSKTWA